MTAAVLEGVEKPVVLQDVADPVAASGFAIVRLKAAALNHRDLWIQKGRLVVYGATAGNPPGFEARRVFFRQISVLGSTMGSPEDFAGITRLVGERRLEPAIDSVRPLAEAEQALRRMDSAAQFGKLVLTTG